MLVYEITKIPDMTLSKYQAYADSGIEGMLEAQTQFVRQLYRVALNGSVNIHLYYLYNPIRQSGEKIKIYFVFTCDDFDEKWKNSIKKVVMASNIYGYYRLKECCANEIKVTEYKYISIMKKKSRKLQTVVNDEENYFYVIPKWEMRDNARLYNLFKIMQSFDDACCYRVDLYAEKNLDEQIHKNFERPLSYLRNLSIGNKGISEYSKINKEKHDPNADETLKQYEEWLKAVDSSYVYRARVYTLANDKQLCQLLLDSAIVESLESGNAEIIDKIEGDYSNDYLIDKFPNENISEEVPKPMQKWDTTFTIEEIAPFMRLPVLYDGENIELPKETSAELSEEGMLLGIDTKGYNVNLEPKLFAKHMFVCGVPGSGKTNTMLHIANSLWNNCSIEKYGKIEKINIPFLVLEPAKKEYRELALMDIPELIIFSPSASTDFPMQINPFEFAIGLTLSEHISNLCQVFEGAFPIQPPAPFILDRAIEAIYKKHGWGVYDVNVGEKEYPTMQELYNQFEFELNNTNYDSEVKGNIRSVLEMRIGSLLRREKKAIFNVKTSTLSPEEWLKYPVIIELESLGEGPSNFVTLLLCTLIREVLKVNPLENKEMPVRHVIFIEEAHNLIAPEAQVQNGQDSNPKIAATAFIVKMLAEVRALREGIIIADQLPTAMAPEVIKNTNVKLVHRLTSADDRELVASTMSASALQMEALATYTSGQALYTYEKLLRPFEMQVSLVEEHGERTPNDKELYQKMLNKPGYVNIRKREEERKFSLIKKEVQELNLKEVEILQSIITRFNTILNKKHSDRVKELNTYGGFYRDMLKLKERIEYLISDININYIEKNRIDELKIIVNGIGKKLQNTCNNLAEKIYQ